MMGATNPNGTGRLQYTIALGEPGQIKFMIRLDTRALVPLTFVNAGPFAVDTGGAAIRQNRRRVVDYFRLHRRT